MESACVFAASFKRLLFLERPSQVITSNHHVHATTLIRLLVLATTRSAVQLVLRIRFAVCILVTRIWSNLDFSAGSNSSSVFYINVHNNTSREAFIRLAAQHWWQQFFHQDNGVTNFDTTINNSVPNRANSYHRIRKMCYKNLAITKVSKSWENTRHQMSSNCLFIVPIAFIEVFQSARVLPTTFHLPLF